MPHSSARLPLRRASLPLAALILLAPVYPSFAAELAPAHPAADFLPGQREEGPGFRQLAPFGDRLVTAGRDEAHGLEPWITDGTAAGSRRLADIAPGRADSDPRLFTALGDKLLFVARDGYRTLLYRYAEGSGVAPLAELPALVASSAVLGSKAYFSAHDGKSRVHIYESDGTPAGTRLLADVCQTPSGCFDDRPQFFKLGDRLYFYTNYWLFSLEEGQTPQQVDRVAFVEDPVALDAGRFVMRGCTEIPDCRLWVSDGSAAGTFALDPQGGVHALGELSPVAFGGRVYAVNDAGAVISVDGSAGGERAETGFPPGADIRLLAATAEVLIYGSGTSVTPYNLRALRADGTHLQLAGVEGILRYLGTVAGRVVVADSTGGIWRSDGTPGGTQRTGLLWGDSILLPGAELGGHLYLTGTPPGDFKSGLFRLGAGGPLEPAFASRSVALSSEARSYALGGSLVVAALGEASQDTDESLLWRVDPATFATVPAYPGEFEVVLPVGERLFAKRTSAYPDDLVAIGPSSASVAPLPLGERIPTAAGRAADQSLLFSDQQQGEQVWRSDGTPAGTFELFDLRPNPNWQDWPGWCFDPQGVCPEYQLPSDILAIGQQVYAVADADLAAHGRELWVKPAPGTPARKLLDLSPPYEYGPHPKMQQLAGGRALVPNVEPNGIELRFFTSDGTAAGTRILPTLTYYGPGGEIAPLGAGVLYFTVHEGGLLAMADPLGPLAPAFFAADLVSHLTPVGDTAFFRAAHPHSGAELWLTDGTPAGTRMLDIRPGLLSALGPELEIHALGDGRVAFAADDGVAGNELFLSDGTREGTVRLTDIAPGPAASNPRRFARIGDRLFFEADDGGRGAELWAVDLPPARPACPPEKLCLHGGRFEVEATATGDGVFAAQRALAGAESGVLSFFGPENWELMVKVLDGCHLNERFWVFSAAATDVAYELRVLDRATGERRTYRHAAGAPARPELDNAAFAGCLTPAPPATYAAALPVPPLAGRCADDPAELCLGSGGRFRVRLTWNTATATGRANPVPYGSLDSGIFTFFSPSNWEMLVKVLDGCGLNGRHWVFAAGTTDVGWELQVEDRETGEIKTYTSQNGQPSRTLTDIDALGGCG
jgi:ELWxxDGT repeat protein